MSVRLALFPITTTSIGQVTAVGSKAGDVVLQVLLITGPASGPVDVTSYFSNQISQAGSIFQTAAAPNDSNGNPLQGVCVAVLDSARVDPAVPYGSTTP